MNIIRFGMIALTPQPEKRLPVRNDDIITKNRDVMVSVIALPLINYTIIIIINEVPSRTSFQRSQALAA